MTYRDWFFKQFPDYHQANDSFKDGVGEGLLQRYLRIYGLELDEQVIPYIENFTEIIDVALCDAKFLPLIATLLGSPPSFGSEQFFYRKVLAYAIQIYKIKGTKKSYQMFLGILGFTIQIIEETPKRRIYYDLRNIKYDQAPDPEIYDSKCDYCSGYWVAYALAANVDAIMPQETLDLITSVLCFLQPINAKFLGLVRLMPIEDTYNTLVQDDPLI